MGVVGLDGLLRRADGLGRCIRQKLLDESYPVVTTLGNTRADAIEIIEAARDGDRVLLLMAKDTGRVPGMLVCGQKGSVLRAPGEEADKVSSLIIQPDPHGGGPVDFDNRTTIALAEQIVSEMNAC